MDDDFISREAAKTEFERYGAEDDAIAVLNSIPAADVKPVKCGKWVRNKNNGLCYCSECDAPAPVEDVYGETILNAPYCYKCGAKMEG